MRAEITGAVDRRSKADTPIVMMFFRNDEGTFKTYLDPQNRNFERWKSLVMRVKDNDEKGIQLNGLQLKGEGLVNADSLIVEIKPE